MDWGIDEAVFELGMYWETWVRGREEVSSGCSVLNCQVVVEVECIRIA